MTKSIQIAYLCWITGGLFGLHYAYLGRNKKALVWFSTFGGFILGFISDLIRIPRYVKEANLDECSFKKLETLKSQIKVPAFFGQRFFGAILSGLFINLLVIYSLPTENLFLLLLVKLLAAFSVSLIVYLIGTEFPMKCDFKWPMIGSLTGLLFSHSSSIYLVSIISTFFLNWNINWENDFKNKKEIKTKKKILIFGVYSTVFVLLVSLFIWNNATLHLNDGRTVTLKEAITEFINSPQMQKTFELLETLWNYYKAHGFRKTINHHFYGYDPEALENAYKIIEINEILTNQEEISRKCKQLSRKWHPDKYKDPIRKQEAEKKFIEIQAACNLISQDRIEKSRQNQKPS